MTQQSGSRSGVGLARSVLMAARPAAVVTSLDVIDNFVASRRSNRDLVGFSGQDIWELSQQVQAFAAAYVPPATEIASHAVYIGGWTSANFWTAIHSPLILSTLLHSGQVLVKDPLIDWFSLDRYRSDQVLPSRHGYLTDRGQPAIGRTRAFLGAAWPSLQQLRPLIEVGALVLVPSESFIAANSQLTADLVAALETEPGLGPRTVTDKFRPAELARSDIARGMFTFAGGDADVQLQRAVRRSLEYFAREYLLAQHYGANYSAPWNYEQYICEQGLEKSLRTSESQRVVHALWSSKLPIFQGLTPALLAQVRQDDAFVGFRAALYDAYRGLPAGVAEDEYARYVAEAEGALLQPHISAAERSARSGLLSRVGVQLAGLVAQLGGAYVVDLAKGEVGGPTLLQGAVAQIISPRLGQPRQPVMPHSTSHRWSIRTTIVSNRGTSQMSHQCPSALPRAPC